MTNRARMTGDPGTIRERFDAKWFTDASLDGRGQPWELAPFGPAYAVRDDGRGRGVELMNWDLPGGRTKSALRGGSPPRPLAMTNVRSLSLPQWRVLAENPENRCIIPLTEFCHLAREKDAERGRKGELWFGCADQPIFGVAALWQKIGDAPGFAMVTCDANQVVASVHPKAMVTILAEKDWSSWLGGAFDNLLYLQQPYPADRMTVRGPVFPSGNS
jgi:putative SOS response-associated peptidase YedK